MRLLLDTHVVLWWLADDEALNTEGLKQMEAAGADVAVSAATIWEIEIKRAVGKLDAPDDLLDQLDASGFHRLAISAEHATHAGRLPRHHDDPFDRMLIAQAAIERRTVVTRDVRFGSYDVEIIPA